MAVNTRVQDPQASRCSLFLEVTVLGYFGDVRSSELWSACGGIKLRHIRIRALFAIQLVNLLVKSALIPLT